MEEAYIYSGFLIVYFFVMSVLWIVMYVSTWFIFQKAGEKGWKSIIPVYNNYIFVKISGKPLYYFWIMWLPLIFMCVFYANMIVQQLGDPFLNVGFRMVIAIALVITGIISIVYNVRVVIALCDRFGISRWFTLAMFTVPIIALPVLAFGDYKYSPMYVEDING